MSTLFYVRTAEGQAAAYDATSAMPRKLKSLLKVVDGKTSLAVFTSSLKAFGDVQGLLTSLQHAGLIEIREQPDASQAATQAPVEPESSPPSVGFASALVSKIGFRAARSQADAFALTQSAHTQPPTLMEPRPGATENNQEQEQQQKQDLQVLVQDMSSFVLAYVPEQAFSVLSELEQINAMEQMAVLLGGYELMVRHVGEPARIHLLHVRQVLSKWL